jgi:RES domain
VRGGLNEAARGRRRVGASVAGRDVRDFPAFTLAAGEKVFRVHRRGHSPWWFSCDGSQRFDVPPPYGTCYLAEHDLGAFVETLGRLVVIPTGDIAERRLAEVTIAHDLRLADCTATMAAAFGVTATTSAGYPYDTVSHPWARLFWRSGFDGVRYSASHDPSFAEHPYGLFGRSDVAYSLGRQRSAPISPDLLARAQAVFGFKIL